MNRRGLASPWARRPTSKIPQREAARSSAPAPATPNIAGAIVVVATILMIALPGWLGRTAGLALRVVIIEHLAVIRRLRLISPHHALIHEAAILLGRNGPGPATAKRAAAAIA